MSSTIHKHILSIDDDPAVLEIIKLTLEHDDWAVNTARCGQEGVIKAVAKPPNVILSDISMPDMDGFDTLHALRSNSVTRKIPIIFLTAEPDYTIHQKATQLGVKLIIAKPFDPHTLDYQIKQAIGWNT